MSGVCGKKPDVAAMQDLLVYVTKGISAITTALRQEGKQVSAKINHLITLNLFTTITNANFDKESIESRIRATLTEKEVLLKQVTNLTVLPEAAKWNGSENWEESQNCRCSFYRKRGYSLSARVNHLRFEGTFRLLEARKCVIGGQR